MYRICFLGFLPLFLLLACASGPDARHQLAESGAAIRSAEELDAKEMPEASLYLKLAKDNRDKGEKLFEKDEHEKAQMYLERAEIDAEVAIALMREREARRNLNQLESELKEFDERFKQQQRKEGE